MMDHIESVGYLRSLSARHSNALRVISEEWKAADLRCEEVIFPGHGIETDRFRVVAEHQRDETRRLVSDAYDKVVIPLLSRLPSEQSLVLQRLWDEWRRDCEDPRKFWNSDWTHAAQSINLQIDACVNREIARLAADPNTERQLLIDVESLRRWCESPFGLSIIADARDAAPKGWSDSRTMWEAIDPAAAIKAWPHFDEQSYSCEKFARVVDDFLGQARQSQRRLNAALSCGLLRSLAPRLRMRLGKSVIKVGAYQLAIAARMATSADFGLRATIAQLDKEGQELADVLVEAQAVKLVAGGSTPPDPTKEPKESTTPPSPPKRNWTSASVRAAAHAHLKHNPFPGVRPLARLLGCPLSSLSDAIDSDPVLAAKREGHLGSRRRSPVAGKPAGDAVKELESESDGDSEMERADAMIDQLLNEAPSKERESVRDRFREHQAEIRTLAERAVASGDLETVQAAQDAIRELIQERSPNTPASVRTTKTREI